MIPKSGYRFSAKIMLKQRVERCPAAAPRPERFTMRLLSTALTMLLLAAPGAAPAAAKAAKPAALDLKAVNEAQFSARRSKGISPAILKAQILLDRARFSPGTIDGRGGENFDKAVSAFAEAQGLADNGLTKELFDNFAATSTEPVLQEYAVSAEDVKGPFVPKIPARMEDMATLDRLGYRDEVEALAEKFHMDEGLLKAFNPGKPFGKAGTAILVANVKNDKPGAKAGKLVVRKSEHALHALDKDGKLVAFYPASIGSEEKPAPSGSFKIERVAQNPTYTYNP